jgi:hypothetical protein
MFNVSNCRFLESFKGNISSEDSNNGYFSIPKLQIELFFGPFAKGMRLDLQEIGSRLLVAFLKAYGFFEIGLLHVAQVLVQIYTAGWYRNGFCMGYTVFDCTLNLRWQVVLSDYVSRTKDKGPFDGVFQFTDIPRPSMVEEAAHHFPTELFFLVPALVVAFEKMRNQQGDILPSLPQGRQTDVDDFQPEVQVPPKQVLADHPGQVAMRCSHDTDVRLNGLDATDPGDLAVLDNTEDLGLRRERHVADLVEKDAPRQRARISLFAAEWPR